MNELKSIQVTCAVILKGDRILVTRRSPDMPHPNKWEFPGGKLEAGETERDCIVREIKEELAIEIEPIIRLTPVEHRYQEVKVKLIPFLAKYLKGEVVCAEHSEFKWLKVEELGKLNWVAADWPIVDEVMDFEF